MHYKNKETLSIEFWGCLASAIWARRGFMKTYFYAPYEKRTLLESKIFIFFPNTDLCFSFLAEKAQK